MSDSTDNTCTSYTAAPADLEGEKKEAAASIDIVESATKTLIPTKPHSISWENLTFTVPGKPVKSKETKSHKSKSDDVEAGVLEPVTANDGNSDGENGNNSSNESTTTSSTSTTTTTKKSSATKNQRQILSKKKC